MSFTHIWLHSYLHPHRALNALAEQPAPRYGEAYAMLGGVILALLF